MWGQGHTLASTYWFHSRSGDSLVLPVTRPNPSLLPRLPPLLFESRANLVVHLRLRQLLSPFALDTSRDLNSFYFPYISRFTTPSCHPPASYISSNGFSLSFTPLATPALPSLNRPPTLCSPAPPFSPARLFRALFLIRHCYQRASYPWRVFHPPTLGDECLGLREDPLDRERIFEEKHIREGGANDPR